MDEKLTALLVVGTRPEAIKMAPVFRALEASNRVRPVLVSSGQHRELLSSTLAALELKPQLDLDVMLANQSPNQVAARVLEKLGPIIAELRPHLLLVQGDTTTVLAASLAAFHLGLPIGHVEAGLRTNDLRNPFPEEANRQLVDRLSTWCFVPTASGRENLLAESISPQKIHVTGNTAVDALLWARTRTQFRLPTGTVLMTLHRRESFGAALEATLRGVLWFLNATPDAAVFWPVHPNPNVAAAAARVLGNDPRVRQVEPLDYVSFAGALATCKLVLTDSGGIQEEGPSLGKMVLVARDTTERPEAVTSGRNRIVGRTSEGVRDGLLSAWLEEPYEGLLPAPNPYGDGLAGLRISQIVCETMCG